MVNNDSMFLHPIIQATLTETSFQITNESLKGYFEIFDSVENLRLFMLRSLIVRG